MRFLYFYPRQKRKSAAVFVINNENPPMGARKDGKKGKETERPPNISLEGPTKSPLYLCKGTSGKMCRHNLTGYISPNDRAKSRFNLVGFPDFCAKYSGFQSTHGGSNANNFNLHRQKRFCKSPRPEEVRICTELPSPQPVQAVVRLRSEAYGETESITSKYG